MKLLALLQTLLLLTTSLIPEGRVMMAGAGACTGECGCSSESREAGNCCCSKAEQEQPAKSQERETARTSCCKKATPSEKTCCSGKSSLRPCCSKSNDSDGNRDAVPECGVISTCPCGSSFVDASVIHGPRTVVTRVQIQSGRNWIRSCTILDDCCSPERPAPATPPPKSSTC